MRTGLSRRLEALLYGRTHPNHSPPRVCIRYSTEQARRDFDLDIGRQRARARPSAAVRISPQKTPPPAPQRHAAREPGDILSTSRARDWAIDAAGAGPLSQISQFPQTY